MCFFGALLTNVVDKRALGYKGVGDDPVGGFRNSDSGFGRVWGEEFEATYRLHCSSVFCLTSFIVRIL